MDNIYANINVNWLNPYKEQKLTIIGEKGMIVFDDTLSTNKLKIYKDYLTWSKTIPVIPIPQKSEGENVEYDGSKSPLLKECEHFVECCEKRLNPITDGEEGLRVLEVLKLSSESLSKNGEALSFKKKTNIFVHKTATVDNLSIIKEGTKIWHYSHVCDNCEIGKNCNIGQNVFIASGSKLGDNCKVQNNVSVYAGVECGNNVFLGPSCVFTNDINPRAEFSKNGKYMKTIIEDGVTIGANATIVCGNTIGKYALIGAGTVVTRNIEPYSVMVGNPARKIGITDEFGTLSTKNH